MIAIALKKSNLAIFPSGHGHHLYEEFEPFQRFHGPYGELQQGHFPLTDLQADICSYGQNLKMIKVI